MTKNNVIHGLKPTILMVIAETILGASNVLFKLASNDGSDLRILVAYRFLFAAVFMIPVALFVERNKRPRLTWKRITVTKFVCFELGLNISNIYHCNYQSCYCHYLHPSYLLQAKIAEHYPCPYSSTALMVTMTSIQCTLYSLCVQRDWSQWKLGWNIRLLTAAYSGVMATGVMFTLFAWCVHMRGPLFVSAFNPLMVVIVALAGPLVLNETIYLGSMLGGITIICGLYVLLWGKAKEMKGTAQCPGTSSKDSTKPDKIVLATSSSGASENLKNVDRNNSTLNGATMRRDAVANIDEESDEIRIVEDQVN